MLCCAVLCCAVLCCAVLCCAVLCLPGDAFRAGFAVGLVSGWPQQQCLQFAAAAGAIAVSRKGALPSLPTLQEVVQHLQAHADQVDPLLLEQLGRLAKGLSKKLNSYRSGRRQNVDLMQLGAWLECQSAECGH
jgi:hypothetical protein